MKIEIEKKLDEVIWVLWNAPHLDEDENGHPKWRDRRSNLMDSEWFVKRAEALEE
jgi:hypothetical protein